jgi:hypothetical protein
VEGGGEQLGCRLGARGVSSLCHCDATCAPPLLCAMGVLSICILPGRSGAGDALLAESGAMAPSTHVGGMARQITSLEPVRLCPTQGVPSVCTRHSLQEREMLLQRTAHLEHAVP